MTAEGVALILGAVATLVTSIATAVVLILRRDVSKVHDLVNQNRSDMLQYQNDLIMVLQSNGIIVPRDRSTLAVPESPSRPAFPETGSTAEGRSTTGSNLPE